MLGSLSLFSKTFIILGLQLFVTFIVTQQVIDHFREQYRKGQPGITAKRNVDGQLDLEVDWKKVKLHPGLIILINIFLFLILLFFGVNNLTIGIPVFTMWSITTGILVAVVLLDVDENLGSRVFNITASITFFAAIIGIYSGIDFSILGGILFISLTILIILHIIRIFTNMGRRKEKVLAFFGVVIFTGYLLFDFNRLKNLEEVGRNTWPEAMNLAINIYLDIINLFLDLLDLLSA